MSSSEIFNCGKRLYVVGDYSKALEYLAKACKLISAEQNDTCDELYEPYLYYARCLYMFSKFSSDCIGDGLKDKIPGDEDPPLGSIEEDNEDDVNGSDHLNTVDNEENTTDESTFAKTDTDDKEDDGVGYLEMAYETVECAKLILKRKLETCDESDKKDIDLQLADCCDLTGDIYVEEEVMKEALEQYETALQLRQRYLPCSERAISESYYKIAVAYNIDYQLAEAKKNFVKCRDVLVSHKDRCMKKKEDTSELEEIIAEIEEKIVETEDGEKEQEHAKETLKQFLAVTMTTSVTADISHLVRKRPKEPRDEHDQDSPGPSSKVPKKDV